MSARMQFAALIVIGLIVVLVSVFAHALGLGSSGFGAKKLAGTIVGLVIIVIGLVGAMRTS